MNHNTDIPVVIARRDRDGNLYFRCDFCRETHHHGSGEGHRVAHCHNPKSPYNERGYILKVEGK